MSWTTFLLLVAGFIVAIIVVAPLTGRRSDPVQLPITDGARNIANSEMGCVALIVYASGLVAVPLAAWYGIPPIVAAAMPLTAPYVGSAATWAIALIVLGGLAFALFTAVAKRLDRLERAVRELDRS